MFMLAQTTVPGVDTLDRALQTDISTLYAVAFLSLVVALIVLAVVIFWAVKTSGNNQSSGGKVVETLTKTLSEVFGAYNAEIKTAVENNTAALQDNSNTRKEQLTAINIQTDQIIALRNDVTAWPRAATETATQLMGKFADLEGVVKEGLKTMTDANQGVAILTALGDLKHTIEAMRDEVRQAIIAKQSAAEVEVRGQS